MPTVRGAPDHGDAWTRPWTAAGEGAHAVACPDFRLTRRIRRLPGSAVADYRLTAAPGYRFVWAAHALLDVSPDARLALPEGAPARLYADGGAAFTPFAWPHAPGTAAGPAGGGGGARARAPARSGSTGSGPDDGTALGAVVHTPAATVHDGSRHAAVRPRSGRRPAAVGRALAQPARLPGTRAVPLHRRRTDARPRLRPRRGGGGGRGRRPGVRRGAVAAHRHRTVNRPPYGPGPPRPAAVPPSRTTAPACRTTGKDPRTWTC